MPIHWRSSNLNKNKDSLLLHTGFKLLVGFLGNSTELEFVLSPAEFHFLCGYATSDVLEVLSSVGLIRIVLI